jgi:hypothetical protein
MTFIARVMVIVLAVIVGVSLCLTIPLETGNSWVYEYKIESKGPISLVSWDTLWSGSLAMRIENAAVKNDTTFFSMFLRDTGIRISINRRGSTTTIDTLLLRNSYLQHYAKVADSIIALDTGNLMIERIWSGEKDSKLLFVPMVDTQYTTQIPGTSYSVSFQSHTVDKPVVFNSTNLTMYTQITVSGWGGRYGFTQTFDTLLWLNKIGVYQEEISTNYNPTYSSRFGSIHLTSFNNQAVTVGVNNQLAPRTLSSAFSGRVTCKPFFWFNENNRNNHRFQLFNLRGQPINSRSASQFFVIRPLR